MATKPRLFFRFVAPLRALGDFIMMRKQLLNLKRLAQGSLSDLHPAQREVSGG